MSGFVPKESGTAAPGWAFGIKRDRGVAEEAARSGWLRNFAPRGRCRKRIPTPSGVSHKFRALLANSGKEKIARSPQYPRGFHVSFPPLRTARTNRRSTAKATMAQETDAPPAIAN